MVSKELYCGCYRVPLGCSDVYCKLLVFNFSFVTGFLVGFVQFCCVEALVFFFCLALVVVVGVCTCTFLCCWPPSPPQDQPRTPGSHRLPLLSTSWSLPGLSGSLDS